MLLTMSTLAFGHRCIPPAGASLARRTARVRLGRDMPAGGRIGALGASPYSW